jgi:uncharacterized protein (TIGR02246 family)
MQSFAKAFESRDARALAALWTADGEYHNDGAATTRGRDAFSKAFATFFANTPEPKAEVRFRSLRFLATNSALGEGSVTVRQSRTGPPSRSHFEALFVREGGHWLLAQMMESADESVSLADLAWLVGEWKSMVGQDAEIRTVYSWAPSKKFLNVQFTLKEKTRTFSGNQVIGIDPATGAIHSWTFEANGGVGEADWNRDGDHWVLDAAGTLTDGGTLTEKNILRRVNNDTFTWQSIDRVLDDVEISDLPPVKVTRVKSGQ